MKKLFLLTALLGATGLSAHTTQEYTNELKEEEGVKKDAIEGFLESNKELVAAFLARLQEDLGNLPEFSSTNNEPSKRRTLTCCPPLRRR